LDNFKEGRICPDCNNGWMSELESEAMGVLKPLMDGQMAFEQLSEEEKRILTRWSFKTAIVLNSGSNFYKLVPLEHYELVYNNKFPATLLVTATSHNPNSRFYLAEINNWVGGNSKVDKSKLRKGVEDAYKTVMQFRNLILMVAYWPIYGWKYNLEQNTHYMLHKPSKMGIEYYKHQIPFPTNDTERAVVSVSMSLEVS
jgi:hypothetical protein